MLNGFMKTRIDTLIHSGDDQPLTPSPLRNPLIDMDACHEAVLLGATFFATAGIGAILFDLRPALFSLPGNTGVLIVRGASGVTVNRSPSSHLRVWVVSGIAVRIGRGVRVQVGELGGDLIELIGTAAEFYCGDVEGIGDVAAELGDGTDRYIRSTPDWSAAINLAGHARVTTSRELSH
jgi:hypothetical protein